MKRTTAVISARVPVHLIHLTDLHAAHISRKRADVVEEALEAYLDSLMAKPVNRADVITSLASEKTAAQVARELRCSAEVVKQHIRDARKRDGANIASRRAGQGYVYRLVSK